MAKYNSILTTCVLIICGFQTGCLSEMSNYKSLPSCYNSIFGKCCSPLFITGKNDTQERLIKTAKKCFEGSCFSKHRLRCVPTPFDNGKLCHDNTSENLTDLEVLLPPCRVTVDYMNSSLSPLVLILKWDRIPGAEFYIVQIRYKGEVDWTVPSCQQITIKNELIFKNKLCPIYEFRVAAANRIQMSRFSKIITSPSIKDLPKVNIVFDSFVTLRQNRTRYVMQFSIPTAWKITPRIEAHLSDYIRFGNYAIFLKSHPLLLFNTNGSFNNAYYRFYPFTLKYVTRNDFLLYVSSLIFKCPRRTLVKVPVEHLVGSMICFNSLNTAKTCDETLTSLISIEQRLARTKKNDSKISFLYLKSKSITKYLSVSVTNSTIPQFCANPKRYASEMKVKPVVRRIFGRNSIICKHAIDLINENKNFTNTKNKTKVIPDNNQKSMPFQSTPFQPIPSQSHSTTSQSIPSVSNVITVQRIPSQSILSIIIIFIISSFIFVGGLFIILWTFCKSQSLIFKKIMGRSNPLYFFDYTRNCDEWEILRNKLIIHEDQKLGSGAFGSVYKGEIKQIRSINKNYAERGGHGELVKSGGYVAIKMLPRYADHICKADFLKEINLMKTLGYHKSIVNMIACITKTEPICLIVEYCSDGDLLNYLRIRRDFLIKLNQDEIYLSPNGLKCQDSHNMLLSLKDLLSLAWQASVGMEYLGQKGFIHRDVAARNILVTDGKKAKIGDFGLCRFSNNDVIYIGRGGRLPLKWMALESITNFEFTYCSDVWSFGVVLFEIITLGGSPYPGVIPSDMKEYLKRGKRMKKPDNCPDELYKLMLKTWHEFPNARPTFMEIAEVLSTMLEHLIEDYYLSINQAMDYYNVTYTGDEPGKPERNNDHKMHTTSF